MPARSSSKMACWSAAIAACMKARLYGSGPCWALAILTAHPVYDIVRGEILRASQDSPLVIPEDAVVVAGARAISRGKAAEWGLSLYTPVIVKYRDEKTELSLELEDLLR